MVRVIDPVKNLREFKHGKAPTVYLPFVGFLFKYSSEINRYLTRIVGDDTEGVYARLTKLLSEIVNIAKKHSINGEQ